MEAAGLGLGVLPLGSKVYNEIKAYVDSVKNADSDTLALLKHVRNGRRSIDLLDTVAKKDGPIDPQLEILLAEVSGDIQKELDAASQLVRKLRGIKNDDANEKSASLTEDAVKPLSKKSKLTFHWRRENLKKLESHLNSSNEQFNRVLHFYSIYSVSSSREENSSFRDEVNHNLVTLTGTITSFLQLHSSHHPLTEVDQQFAGPSIAPLATTKSLTWTSMDSAKTLVNDAPGQEDQEDASICRCRPKHQRKGAAGGTKWFSLYKQQKTTVAHHIGCPYYGLEEPQVEQTYTVTVNGRHFWDRLSTAVALSVHVPTNRFGSWSISPQMQTYNTIDLERSPAMRLFHLADDLDDVDWDDPAVEKKTRSYWHRRLLELFRTGKASPFDVDHRTNKPMLHFLRVSSRRKMKPYVRLVWETLHQLNFPEHMLLCNGLKPWAYHFSTSHPIKGTKLYAEFLPWNMDRWLEPEDIPESLLGPSVSADIALSRAFILAMIMYERRSLLGASNIGSLCRAIILRSMPKALEILDDSVSSWTEPFLNEEGGICAIDLAIMWFPELMNALLQEDVNSDSRLGRLPLPRPHPSKHSFLEVAVNIGLQHGERHGKAATQEYLQLIDMALKKDYPIYFDRISLHLADAEEMITVHLADRRRRLLELAKKRLPPSSYHSSDIFEPKLVDEKVEEVLQAFTAAGVSIPEGLRPRDMEDPQPLSGSVFEYAWHSEDLCDRLQELDFDTDGFVRSRCHNGPFPMAPMMAPLEWDSWRFLWLEDLIAESKTGIGHTVICYEEPAPSPTLNALSSSRLTTVGHTHGRGCGQAPTMVHALMAFVGRCMPGKLWSGVVVMPSDDLSPFVKPYLLQHVEDDCLCPCTSLGCRPLSMFIKSVLTGHGKSLELFLERVTYLFQILEMIFSVEELSPELTLDVLRICTFDCLGCRHTCCHDSMRDYIFGYSRMLSSGHLDPEEVQEIHDEDKEDLSRLEKVMEQVEVKLQGRDSASLDFVQSQWMPIMRRTVEERDKTNLGQVDIERIREVGVTWENVVVSQSTKQDWYDDDADSAISLNLDRAETDEDRMSAIRKTIDRICA